MAINEDYEGLYSWLDTHEAKECGHNLAVLQYSFDQDLIEELMEDLSKNVNFTARDRLYLIWRDQETNSIKGKFLVGKHKAAPWSGYGVKESKVDEEID